MYDLHNQILLKQDLEFLKHFKLNGIGVVFKNSFNAAKFKSISEIVKSKYPWLDLVSAVEITSENEGEIKKAVGKYRNQVDVVFVSSKSPRAMRAASENPDVDVLSHAFVDQSGARECAANNIALEINLRDILGLYGMKRANLISKINFNLGLARKYKTPLLLTTGAGDIYGMRSPKQLMAFAQCIGFTAEEAKSAILKTPLAIVEKNREKLAGKIVSKGVRRV